MLYQNGAVHRIVGKLLVIPGVGSFAAGQPMDVIEQRFGEPDKPGCRCEGLSYRRHGLFVWRSDDGEHIQSFVIR